MKLFTFGVGYDVDTVLLDQLAQDHHGSSTYVPPGEDAEAAISSFYQKISAPSLTDLAVSVDGVSAYDLHPNPLPDLFFGSQIIVTGRYRNFGTADITLTGRDGVSSYRRTFTGLEFSSGEEDAAGNNSYIARLWANRKIGALLNQMRLSGTNQEILQQIVALSVRYGIVTPYTSYLVTEPDALGAAAQERIAQQQYSAQVAQPTQVSGEGAVNKAADAGAMSAAENLGATGMGGGGGSPASPGMPSLAEVVKSAGSRTFVMKDGVWVDTRYDPDTMKPIQVQFLSKEYFSLVTRSVDIAAGLALGERVILVVGDTVYEIVE
jgi:Ca-activated chloride channel family protein